MNISKTICALALLLTAGLALHAQDVVTLKNGSFIKGTIIEYIVDDHVRIKTEEGKVYEYPASDVQSTQLAGQAPAGSPVVRKPLTIKEKGYYNLTGFHLAFGNNYGLNAGAGLSTENGYQWTKRLMTGASVGVEYLNEATRVPLTVNVRYKLLDGPVTPFAGVFAGYTLSGKPQSYYYESSLAADEKNYGGFTSGAQVGLLAYCAPHFGIFATAGYRYQKFTRDYAEYYWSGTQMIPYMVTEQQYLHRVTLGLGFLFN